MSGLYYIDSSVAIHVMDQTDDGAVTWFEERLASGDSVVSSSLLRVEVARYLRRGARPLSDSDELLDNIAFSPVDEALLDEAAVIEPYIKTLDAVHLATAIRMGGALTALVSDDVLMLKVAGVLGIDAYSPMDDKRI